MTIDFHTHIWPDNIAKRALPILEETSQHIYEPVTNGTLDGLITNMINWNIDLSVVQPVITKETQITHTNEWAQNLPQLTTQLLKARNLPEDKCKVLSFGGIYVHCNHWKQDIDFVHSLGLKGLKFHPEYQNFQVDDPEMLPIYDYALSKGLILLFHAGFDPGYKPPFKSSPRQFANILKAMKGGTIIAAHLGGHAQWDDVLRYLCGTNIYLDTSMGFKYYSEETFLSIVKKHGADKILFGSDSPWSNASSELQILKNLPLSETQINAIAGNNAKRLLEL